MFGPTPSSCFTTDSKKENLPDTQLPGHCALQPSVGCSHSTVNLVFDFRKWGFGVFILCPPNTRLEAQLPGPVGVGNGPAQLGVDG